jgi:hypothetical protein
MVRTGFPRFDYYVDESDPNILVLRRHDGCFVAAFSARGATREGIIEAAESCEQNVSSSGVEVRPSRLSGPRRIADVNLLLCPPPDRRDREVLRQGGCYGGVAVPDH